MKRTAEPLLVVASAVVLAIVLTWPIAARFGSAGRIDSGDGRFSVWNVAWVAHALTNDPATLFDANIFFPHENALAFSEANLVAGVLAIPAWLITGNAYAAMNSVILACFVLAFVCMYALVKHLTGNVRASAVTAILYAFCPYAFAHIPQIQLMMTFGPPLALLCLHRFVEAPDWRRACVLGGALALQALACGYYGLYGGLAIALGAIWLGLGAGQWRRPQYWGLLVLAATVALVLVVPFFLPYLDIRDAGFRRTLDDARLFSAGWRAYLASALVLHRWMLPLLGTWREVLFPGFLAITLSIVMAVLMTRRRMRDYLPVPPHLVGFYFVLAGLAFWASFGPDAGLYTLLYRTLPVLSLLRAPARFGLFVTVALQVTAGLALAAIMRAWSRRRGLMFANVLIVYAIVRSMVGGLDLAVAPPVPQAYRQLAGMPRGAVAEFPYFSESHDRFRHTEYMLMSVYHWQPLINGYSDHIPNEAFEDMPKLARFPSSDAWEVLQHHRARYVIVHWDRYEEAEERDRVRAETDRMSRYLMTVVDAPDASLYQILRFPNDDTSGTGG